jgi:hypothetical protein
MHMAHNQALAVMATGFEMTTSLATDYHEVGQRHHEAERHKPDMITAARAIYIRAYINISYISN